MYGQGQAERKIHMETNEANPQRKAADDLYSGADMEGALAAYRQLLLTDPGEAWAHSRIGAILAQRGENDRAEESLRTALELDPALPQAHSNLGNVFYAKGDYEQAVVCYLAATKIDSSNPIYFENLHAAYKQQKKFAEAVKALKQAHRLTREAGMAETKAAYQTMKNRARGRLGCGAGAAILLVLTSGLFLLF